MISLTVRLGTSNFRVIVFESRWPLPYGTHMLICELQMPIPCNLKPKKERVE